MQNFSFCPECGGKLEQRAPEWEPDNPSGEPQDRPQMTCASCGFIFWQNPKPTASAVMIDKEDRVLLVQRLVEPAKGMWDLPGGFVDVDESPEDSVRREIREELGVELEIQDLLGIFMDRYRYRKEEFSTLNMVYQCTVREGTPKASSDVAAMRWFTPDELPEHMAFRNNEDGLDAWLVHIGREPYYRKRT